jgi:hypothetical protein
MSTKKSSLPSLEKPKRISLTHKYKIRQLYKPISDTIFDSLLNGIDTSNRTPSEENVEKIVTGPDKKLSNYHSSHNPYFIIKYGPTGSGKGSSIVSKEIENLGVSLDQYITIEIDKVIESVMSYRQGTLKIKAANNPIKKYNQLTKLGFYNIFIYK